MKVLDNKTVTLTSLYIMEKTKEYTAFEWSEEKLFGAWGGVLCC